VQRVERAVPGGGGGVHAVLVRSVTVAVLCVAGAAGARGHFVAVHIEEVHARIERLAHQQLEGAFGRFQLVAFVFHLLDALQQFAAGIFVRRSARPCCFSLYRMLPRPERSLTSTRWRLPTGSGVMCS
jgi:hypothetical protein